MRCPRTQFRSQPGAAIIPVTFYGTRGYPENVGNVFDTESPVEAQYYYPPASWISLLEPSEGALEREDLVQAIL